MTGGNVHDIEMLDRLDEGIWGKLFGDKGYLSQPKTTPLAQQGIEIVTSIRRNMRPVLMTLEDKILLRKRIIIESVNNLLKNWANIDHSHHRSPVNFFVNLMAGLVDYCWKPDKPTVRLDAQENMLLNHALMLA